MLRLFFVSLLILCVSSVVTSHTNAQEKPQNKPPENIVINVPQLLSQARAYIDQGNLLQARQIYLTLLYFVPNLNLARVELAYILLVLTRQYTQQNQTAAAQNTKNEANLVLSDLYSLLPTDLRPLLTEIALYTENKILEQAKLLTQEGRFDVALQQYRLLLFLIPNWDVARVGLVFTLARLGEREQALTILSRIDLSRLDPSILDAFENLGLGQNQLRFFFLPQFVFNSNLNQRTSNTSIPIPAFRDPDGNALEFDLTSGEEELGYGGRTSMGIIFEEKFIDKLGLNLQLGIRYAKFEKRRYDEFEFFGDVGLTGHLGAWEPGIAFLSALIRLGHDDREEGALGWSVRSRYTQPTWSLNSSVTLQYTQGYRDWRDVTDRRVIQVRQSLAFVLSDIGTLGTNATITLTDWYHQNTSDNREIEIGTRFTWATLPYIRPTLSLSWKGRWHEREDNLFLRARHDDQMNASISVCIRVLTLWGQMFCPRYRYTRNISTIPLNDYHSHQVDVQFQAWVW